VLDASLSIEFKSIARVSDSKTAKVLTERCVEDVESVRSRDENHTSVDGERSRPRPVGVGRRRGWTSSALTAEESNENDNAREANCDEREPQQC